MRVLHVLDISIPMIAGYSSRSRYIVNNQKALGIDPVVLTSVRFDSKDGVSMEEIDGIRYHRTLPPPRPRRLARRPFFKEGLEIDHLRRRIVEVARAEQPDVIHAHSSILCGVPAFLAARQLGLPCVYEIRAFWEDAAVDAGTNREGSPKYVAIQRTETELAKHVDALIGICAGIKRELMERGIAEEDIFVVPNGVDIERFKPIAKDERVARRYGVEGKTVVGYIGTFAAFEGVRYLVSALAKLIRSGRDDIRGLIVGEGPCYEACRELATQLGVEGKVLHPGRVPHAEVQELYSVVDVLAYPRESLRITELVTPLKPLEAMAMEKVVIGSDVGGLRELIDDGVTGLLHRHEDVDDLAKKILQVVDDAALRRRLGTQGRAYVIQSRSWLDIIESHFGVYDRARHNWAKNRFVWRGLAKIMDRLEKNDKGGSTPFEDTHHART